MDGSSFLIIAIVISVGVSCSTNIAIDEGTLTVGHIQSPLYRATAEGSFPTVSVSVAKPGGTNMSFISKGEKRSTGPRGQDRVLFCPWIFKTKWKVGKTPCEGFFICLGKGQGDDFGSQRACGSESQKKGQQN